MNRFDRNTVASIALSNLGAFAVYSATAGRFFAFAASVGDADQIAATYRREWGYSAAVVLVDESLVASILSA